MPDNAEEYRCPVSGDHQVRIDANWGRLCNAGLEAKGLTMLVEEMKHWNAHVNSSHTIHDVTGIPTFIPSTDFS